MTRKLEKNRHSVYSLKYNLVVTTKEKKKCINNNILIEIEKIIKRLLNDKNCNLIKFSGEKNYINIIFTSPPQQKLSTLVNSLKTTTSRLIRKDYNKHLKKYYSKNTLWTKSYLLLSAGKITENIINDYIKEQ